MTDDPYYPEAGRGPLMDALMADVEPRPDEHLCPLCEMPLEDTLEECPTCAANDGDA